MVRILVVGPVPSMKDSMPKLNKLNAKSGPFELCLLLNSPSSWPEHEVTVPTYFVADSFSNDRDPRSVGLHINYKGARFNDDLHGLRLIMCANDEAATALCDDLESKRDDFGGMDVLITHRGPRQQAGASDAITRLGRTARPRYHFYGADSFCAFDPFQTAGADYATRVVSVGRSGRWVYAADVAPLQGMSEEDRRKTLPQKPGVDLYMSRQLKRPRGRKDVKRAVQKRARKNCWFCLGNEVEKHLVVAVGEGVYVALAKGGINDSHLVIVPVAHVAGSTSQQASEEMISEVGRFVKAIREYYAKQKSSEAMIFEWCGAADMMHMCVQAIAIRREVCGRVAKVCVETAKRFGLDVKLEDGLNGLREARRTGAGECFWAELPGGQRVVATFDDKKKKLPANFGRVVVAQALGVLDRMEWRKCVLTRACEEQLAEKVDRELRHFLT